MQHNPAPGPEHRILVEGEEIVHKIAWGIRDTGDAFLQQLESIGSSRELNIAKSKIEEAVMWAVRGIPADISTAGPTSIRSFFVDLFDRIAAAIEAKSGGDTTALDTHLAAIDAHLQSLDSDDTAGKAAVLTLQGDDTSSQGRLAAIEAGLQKVADAVNPPSTTTPPPASGGTTTPPPVDPTA